MSKQREALKIALEVLDSKHNFQSAEWRYMHYRVFQIIREALAEQEPEPVAWMHQPAGMSKIYSIEPIPGPDSIPLYTTPPARKPLTDDQIDAEFDRECWATVVFADGTRGIALDKVTAKDFARAIERAHGIDGGHDCWR